MNPHPTDLTVTICRTSRRSQAGLVTAAASRPARLLKGDSLLPRVEQGGGVESRQRPCRSRFFLIATQDVSHGGDDPCRVAADGLRHLDELDHVQAPLAALVLRHVGLRALQPRRKLRLRQPGRDAALRQQRLQRLVARGASGPRHGGATMFATRLRSV